MIAFLLANRTAAEILVALALVGAGVLHERHQGAAQCIASTTETRAVAVADNAAITQAHAAQLTKVVAIYETKLADSTRGNDLLAARLHRDTLRQIPLSCADPAPDRVVSPGALTGGLSGTQAAADPFGIDGATAALFDACTADALELTALQAAWAVR